LKLHTTHYTLGLGVIIDPNPPTGYSARRLAPFLFHD